LTRIVAASPSGRASRQRQRSRYLGVGLCLLLGGASFAQWARADTRAVARVGAFEIGLEEFGRQLGLLAPFQRAALGTTWPEQRRRFLDQVLIPRALLETQAARQKREWGNPADAALSQALLMDLRAEVARSPISDAAIASFYAANRRYYEAPNAILIWRILLAEEHEARELIHLLDAPTAAEFRRLARDRSLDHATHMRGGSLGYVAADGQSHMPEVRVSPSLFAAASRVKDGELVQEPVREGQRFAVVWRRSSRPGRVRALDEVAGDIRMLLEDAQFASESQRLVADLRAASLRDYQPAGLAELEPSPEPAQSPPRGEQVALPARKVRLLPETTDRGLR
jgi:peptidyl-prolyl cis-trans isomerase C